MGKKITRKFPNTKKKKSSKPSGLSQVLDLAIFTEAAPGSGLTGGSPSRGKQLYTYSTCTASNFAPKARRPCADTRREGCEQSARLGNGGSSAMTFHQAPCINLHGGEKRGKKWKKIIKKKAHSPPTSYKYPKSLRRKRQELFFSPPSGTMSAELARWPGRSIPEVSSFLASEDARAAARVIFNTSPPFGPARFLPISRGRYWHGESPPQHGAGQKGLKIPLRKGQRRRF